jgi:hypothetical protein
VLEHQQQGQQQLAFLEGSEYMKAFEHSVLVTNLESDVDSIVQHYRDWADCENNFDELKNHWNWLGRIYDTENQKLPFYLPDQR